MHLIADGERSKQWFAFAKKKLAQLKQSDLPVKTIQVDGYRIQLNAYFDRIRITAPPAVVVTHIEYPPDYDWATNPGRERVYYADCYGTSAKLVGQTGGAGVNAYPVIKTYVKIGGILYQHQPGYGVIFPGASDFYRASVGFTYQPYFPETFIGYVIQGVQQRFAYLAAKSLYNAAGDTYLLQNVAYGGWQLSIDKLIYTTAGAPSAYSADPAINAVELFITGSGPRAYAHFDMAAIRTALGVPAYTSASIYGHYLYRFVGEVRLALFYTPGGATPAEADAARGAYFFEVVRNEVPDGVPTISFIYLGACLTPMVEIKHGGAPSNIHNEALPWKTAPFAEGAGVAVTVHETVPDGMGGYTLSIHTDHFAPGMGFWSDSLGFPPEISDAQVWPVIFNGSDTTLCMLERIADVDCEVVGLYLTGWTALPLPAEPLLAVRPVLISNARIVLVALAWDAAQGATVFMQFDNRDPAIGPWRKFGKVADIRMTRPIVGFFGAHEYTKLAMDCPAAFPVTTRTSTHQYTGV